VHKRAKGSEWAINNCQNSMVCVLMMEDMDRIYLQEDARHLNGCLIHARRQAIDVDVDDETGRHVCMPMFVVFDHDLRPRETPSMLAKRIPQWARPFGPSPVLG